MHTTPVSRKHVHMHSLSECILHSPQKMHMYPSMRAHAAAQESLCHGSYCELLLSLVRALCRLLFAAQPPAQLLSRPNLSSDAVRSRNPSKSALAHDVVAAAVSHKHHSIIHVGPVQVPSSLFMVRTHALLWTSYSTNFYFHHGFCGLF